MSNRVDQLIAEIQDKVKVLKQKLSEEQLKSASLEKKVEEVNNEINARETEISALKLEVTRLEVQLNDKNDISIAVQSDKGISDEEIDELVNEIEYCITQLKK